MMPNPAVGMCLFDIAGTEPYAQAAGPTLPIETDQLEGILAAVGGFDGRAASLCAGQVLARVRYDGYDILGVRGERCLIAAVYPEPIEEPAVRDLHRALAALERRWSKGLLAPSKAPDSENARVGFFARFLRRGVPARGQPQTAA